MKQLTVYLNDYPANKKMSVMFSQHDYDIIARDWDDEDETLKALERVSDAFSGYTKWSTLRTEHYRVLMQRSMIVLESLSVTERQDADNFVVKTFNSLLLRMVKRIEADTGVTIEFMRIHRVAHDQIVWDFSATMNMTFDKPPPHKDAVPVDDSPFKVIVSPDETT